MASKWRGILILIILLFPVYAYAGCCIGNGACSQPGSNGLCSDGAQPSSDAECEKWCHSNVASAKRYCWEKKLSLEDMEECVKYFSKSPLTAEEACWLMVPTYRGFKNCIKAYENSAGVEPECCVNSFKEKDYGPGNCTPCKEALMKNEVVIQKPCKDLPPCQQKK